MSQARGMVRPTPMAGPLMAAMTGLPRLRTMGTSGLPSSSSKGDPARRSPPAPSSWDQPEMSPPAQNARPAPVTTSAPTSRSDEALLTASMNSASI